MRGFIFDINKCVGCHACIVACSVENERLPPNKWRNIYSSNSHIYPDLPVFNLSLACNHCEEASCMKACPTNAYSRDEKTGAIILNPEVCMGCKYCTWACPYDAPKFDENEGVVSKCTFCYSSLRIGGVPACSRNCPTGALAFGEIIDNGFAKTVRGFPEAAIKPRLRFIPERKRKGPEIIPSPVSSRGFKSFVSEIKKPDSKISIKKEWTLLLFTILVPVLVGVIAGVLSGYIYINPFVYSTLGGLLLMLSTMHLGKKQRAIYAIKNLKYSWLSREIFFFGMFLASSIIYLFVLPVNSWIGLVSVILGLICLYAMDRIYKFFRKESEFWLDSSSGFLSGLMWISLVLQEPVPLFFVIGLKTVLFVYKKKAKWQSVGIEAKAISILRLIFLVVVPSILFLIMSGGTLYLFFPLFLGEIIDRTDFYVESYIDSPDRENYKRFMKELEKRLFNSITIN